MTFKAKLQASEDANGSLLCLGLDPEPDLLPLAIDRSPEGIARFVAEMVEAVGSAASSYKLNLAFYERWGREASWLLGASPRVTFLRVTLPLSMPGVFAAVIFGFVGTFGESAVPIILGGVGYQLMGNTITSALDVLNYPLAAAMSSVVVATMLAFLLVWYLAFDLRAVLGKIARWRF